MYMHKKKDLVAWFVDPIRNQYADFEGRTGRREFWMFILTSIVFIMGLNILGSMLLYSHYTANTLSSLAQLAIMVPAWAITARRLHDIGRSGWWQLIGVIPMIGWIVLVIWLAQESNPHENAYGSKPHAQGHGTQE